MTYNVMVSFQILPNVHQNEVKYISSEGLLHENLVKLLHRSMNRRGLA